MKIYDDKGYPNIEEWMEQSIPFHFVVGGRGTGKTFSSLLFAYKYGLKFMFIRNSQTQIERLMKPQYNVFKKINAVMDINVQVEKDGKTGIFKEEDREIGYLAALSTFSNFRGPDLSDVDLVIFDEFIPESHERVVKDSARVFFDCYETIARNRELEGQPPLPVLFLANSNKLDNPMFVELGLVREAEKMMKKGLEYKINKDRGYMIIFLNRSPISEAKKETALYRLIGEDSAYYHMSLSNSFNIAETELIRPMKLTEYKPVVNVGEITVYQHKSNGSYYISGHEIRTKDVYKSTAQDLERFRRRYSWLWIRYLQELIYFEDYMSLALFDIYFRGKR